VRTQFIRVFGALALLVGAAGISAQSADWKTAQYYANLTKQAASGDAIAQNDLGAAYAAGDGGNWPKDEVRAFGWFSRAAEQGLALAQKNVALAYLNGKGVLQDHRQAAAWFRKGAEQGNVEAQYNLGVLYYTGDGVPQEYAESYFWLDIAAPGMLGSANQKWVSNYRDAAAAKLTPEILLQAQERARKWFEDRPQSGKGRPD